jgi:drug/metabolite transporter (DMT)-like permease
VKEAFNRLPGPMRGAIWMLGAATFFATHGPLVRMAATDLDPLAIAFFRSLILFIFVLPWLMRDRGAVLRTKRPGAQVLRAIFSMSGLVFLILAQANLPLAEVSALTFAQPLFATVGAALILRETVRSRRWVATFVGLLGVWIILRPGFEIVDPLFLLPIASAALVAASNLMIKSLSAEDAPNTVVAWLIVLSVPVTLVPALFAWSLPEPQTLIWLALLAGAGLIAHQCLVRSFAAADASAVLPYDYMRLVVTATLAFLAFGEVPTIWTWIGGAVIVGAVVYIARREAAAARDQ